MWLSDLRIVLPDRVLGNGSLCIEDGLITEIIEGSAPGGVPSSSCIKDFRVSVAPCRRP
jgi:alpha-D-ribose 1-methylphosphonate 5-triphosphate diphosphatase PhnM